MVKNVENINKYKKTKHVDYTLRNDHIPLLHINNTKILTETSTKYRGFYIDSRGKNT